MIAMNIPKIAALKAVTILTGSMFPAMIPSMVPIAQDGMETAESRAHTEEERRQGTPCHQPLAGGNPRHRFRLALPKEHL